jgi:hypothetical protein
VLAAVVLAGLGARLAAAVGRPAVEVAAAVEVAGVGIRLAVELAVAEVGAKCPGPAVLPAVELAGVGARPAVVVAAVELPAVEVAATVEVAGGRHPSGRRGGAK